MRNLSTNQAQKEVIINENFKAVEQAQLFGWRVQNTTGLQFAYWGGIYQDSAGAQISVSDGTVSVNASSTNYVYFDPITNTVLNSTTIPATGNIRIARVITNATSITSVIDERAFALFPVGSPNSLSGGGSSNFFTDTADWQITNVSGRTITLKRPQAFVGLPIEYTSNFVERLTGTSSVTVPASSSGYIVQSSGGQASFVSSFASNTLNILGILYRVVSNATNITTLIDTTKSNLTRITNIVFETSLPVNGNLSKVNIFTAPWSVQNSSGNLETSYRYEIYLKCLTAEHGYAVNNLIQNFNTGPSSGSHSYSPSLRIYGTNGNTVGVVLDASIRAQSLTTFTEVNLTPANWQLHCRIYPLR